MPIVGQRWADLVAQDRATTAWTINTEGGNVTAEVALNVAYVDASCNVYKVESDITGVTHPHKPIVGVTRARNVSFYMKANRGGTAAGRLIVNFWG